MNGQNFFLKAKIDIRDGNYTHAIALLEEGVANVDKNQHVEVYKFLADLYIENNQLAEASKIYDKIEDKELIFYELARLFALQQDTKQAIWYLEKSLLLSHKKVYRYIMSDQAFALLKETAEWRELWQKEWYSVFEKQMQRVDYYYKTNNLNLALEAVNDILFTYKQKWEPYLLRANIFYDMNQFDNAIRDMDKAIDLNRKNPFLYETRAQLLLETKKYKKAIFDLDKVMDLDSNKLNIFFLRGKAYFGNKEYEKAIVNLDFFLQIDINSLDANFLYARSLYEQENYLDAIKKMNKIIQLKSRFEYYEFRADMYQKVFAFQSAIDDYSMALDLNPFRGEIYYKRAKAKLDNGNRNNMCADLKMAIHYKYYQAQDLEKKYCK